jgi:tripeptide aminopeptidase
MLAGWLRIRALRVVAWLCLAMPVASAQSTPQQQVAAAAANSATHAAFDWLQGHEREIADLQLQIARVPAPPFHEAERAEWLRKQFVHLGLEQVRIDSIGNVLGVRRGADPRAHFVAVSAHIDTVFPAGTSLASVRRGEDEKLYGPGISDNAAGIAALLAVAMAMDSARLRTPAPILFIGNVGEEGEGDLRGMRHIFNDPTLRDSIAELIVVDGAGVDTIVTEALGSRRFEVSVHGPGGHSWSDFGAPNPIAILAHAIDLFSATPVPATPKTTYNVGVISGGTSVNSIPESASMRVDIRSSSAAEMDKVEQALRRSVATAVQQSNANQASAANNGRGTSEVTSEIRSIGNRPAAELPESSRLLQIMKAVDAHLGNQSRLHRASTDANVPISQGRDALAVGAGGSGSGAHTVHEWFDPRGRDLGLKRILLALLAAAS